MTQMPASAPRRSLLGRLWSILIGLFAGVGLAAVIAVAVAWWGASRLAGPLVAQDPVPDAVILSLDLTQGLADTRPQSRLERLLTPGPPALHTVTGAIRRAAADDRVQALVVDFAGDSISLATAQELAAAIARFRDAGKPTTAFATSFGELGNGNFSYSLAAGFDDIVLQPVGGVGLTGIRLEVPLAREALDRLGIEPDFLRRGDFKTAPDSFTHSQLSDANRAMLRAIADDVIGQITRRIADGRGLSLAQARAWIDGGPYTAAEALERGLVDRLAHGLDLDAQLEDRFPGAERLSVTAYGERIAAEGPEHTDPAARVALIYGTGPIVTGRSDGPDPWGLTGEVIGSRTVAKALQDAAEAERIDAVVFRINSGGGSAVASEEILRAARFVQEQGKPLVVSMGPSAASGGYWIASSADRIIAQPGSITGSIGVFLGKFVIDDFLADWGVQVGVVERGRHAGIGSGQQRFAGSTRERVVAQMDAVYDGFLERVAAGRGLSPAAVDQIAQGRVWTGQQAVEHGLVDRLGGLDTAYAEVRRLLDLPEDAALSVRTLPRADEFQGLLNLLGAGVGLGGVTLPPWLIDLIAVTRTAPGPVTAPRLSIN